MLFKQTRAELTIAHATIGYLAFVALNQRRYAVIPCCSLVCIILIAYKNTLVNPLFYAIKSRG